MFIKDCQKLTIFYFQEDYKKYWSIQAAEDMCRGSTRNGAFRDSAQNELQIFSA
jgi:hypothetical protein